MLSLKLLILWSQKCTFLLELHKKSLGCGVDQTLSTRMAFRSFSPLFDCFRISPAEAVFEHILDLLRLLILLFSIFFSIFIDLRYFLTVGTASLGFFP